MASPVLQFKRGLFADLPGLRAGEPGFTTDKYDLYVGLTSSTSTNKFFGSHRYWTREDGANSSQLRLVDKDGSNYIAIGATDTLAGIVTYYLPGTQGAQNTVLTNDGNGFLSWASSLDNAVFTGITTVNGSFLDVNVNADFSGITTFSNITDNTLGDPDTGAVQIDGGLGVNGNVTVGAGLSVGGQSYFIGTATFYGGRINLGDSDADDINVAGEFVSNLIPNVDDTYDIGEGGTPKRWRHANFSGVGTFASGVDANDVNIGLSGVNEIDTSSGVLILDSAAGQVQVDDDLSVSGIATFTSIEANTLGNADTGAVQIDGGLGVDGNVTVGSGLSVTNQTTLGSLNVTDLTDTNVVFVGANGELVNDANFTFDSSSDQLSITGSAVVDNIQIGLNDTNEIDTSSGNLTLDAAGGTVIVDANLNVSGNLTIQGNTTTVDTVTLTVEDRTISLGTTAGGIPNTATTWDLGVLFAYNDGNQKQSAVVWEHSDSRFKFANNITESGSTTADLDNPQITITDNTGYAPIEIGALWVNDCAGQSQVISCTGTERFLENITIDAGTF